jgi:hypothetical protein
LPSAESGGQLFEQGLEFGNLGLEFDDFLLQLFNAAAVCAFLWSGR